jgi:hypothetical protein
MRRLGANPTIRGQPAPRKGTAGVEPGAAGSSRRPTSDANQPPRARSPRSAPVDDRHDRERPADPASGTPKGHRKRQPDVVNRITREAVDAGREAVLELLANRYPGRRFAYLPRGAPAPRGAIRIRLVPRSYEGPSSSATRSTPGRRTPCARMFSSAGNQNWLVPSTLNLLEKLSAPGGNWTTCAG